MDQETLRQRFASLSTAHVADACIRAKLPAVGADLDRTAELSLSTAVTD
ncbi:hypothetical protein P3T35_005076 [Kitasatospora sp. GP30]|nr:hypothetical protein [Kitasatospora sp. GP30]MDH6143048.1 hypothetical protein [Kitasatospora sp. GP30]